MPPDWQPWAIAALTAVSSILGWFARELWSAVKALRTDLDTLRVHIAESYIRQDRLAEVMQPIFKQLDRIESALVNKQDKP